MKVIVRYLESVAQIQVEADIEKQSGKNRTTAKQTRK